MNKRICIYCGHEIGQPHLILEKKMCAHQVLASELIRATRIFNKKHLEFTNTKICPVHKIPIENERCPACDQEEADNAQGEHDAAEAEAEAAGQHEAQCKDEEEAQWEEHCRNEDEAAYQRGY